MATLYQCDKCRKTFTKQEDVILVRSEATGLTSDLCDFCFHEVMDEPEIEADCGSGCDSWEFASGTATEQPLRAKAVQLDLTGIAPEDQKNQTN